MYTQAEIDWAEISGEMPDRRPVRYFKHKETGYEYLYILGAFALPGLNLPGYAVVIGLDRHEHPEFEKQHLIRALVEVEDPTTHGLMKKCIDLGTKYSAYPVLEWYADIDKISFGSGLDGIKQAGKEFCDILPASGPYATKDHPWKGYLLFLSQTARFLDRKNCPKLRSYMTQGPKNLKEIMAFRPENNPALAAISVAVATLLIRKPWLYDESSAFNVDDGYEN